MPEIFIEAENFENLGGWVIDQQSMETINSSYIMAHGMGLLAIGLPFGMLRSRQVGSVLA